MNGKLLFLDGIDIAHEDIIQCIAVALDTSFLTVLNPTNAEEIEIIKMKPEFGIVKTHYPSNHDFSAKRNTLSSKLLSKFRII
jgi:hypothetical protein